jgi:hypothetical protein
VAGAFKNQNHAIITAKPEQLIEVLNRKFSNPWSESLQFGFRISRSARSLSDLF